MDRDVDRNLLVSDIYGATGHQFDALPARPLHEVVSVNVKITGCPIEKHELLAAIASLLNGDTPNVPEYPVCTECRLRENRCLLLHDGLGCLGPITAGGCRARCPSLGVPCIGCRGPARDANVEAAIDVFEEHGFLRESIRRRLQTFAPLLDGQPSSSEGER